ncbi:MAG: hypothetical protein NTZ61_14010, partial [Proteobacteria bacterium]|nr:hypothetical protein [Pseudomonadota bacterium]
MSQPRTTIRVLCLLALAIPLACSDGEIATPSDAAKPAAASPAAAATPQQVAAPTQSPPAPAP